MDWGRGRGEGGGDSHIKKDVGNIEKIPRSCFVGSDGLKCFLPKGYQFL